MSRIEADREVLHAREVRRYQRRVHSARGAHRHGRSAGRTAGVALEAAVIELEESGAAEVAGRVGRREDQARLASGAGGVGAGTRPALLIAPVAVTVERVFEVAGAAVVARLVIQQLSREEARRTLASHVVASAACRRTRLALSEDSDEVAGSLAQRTGVFESVEEVASRALGAVVKSAETLRTARLAGPAAEGAVDEAAGRTVARAGQLGTDSERVEIVADARGAVFL